MNDNQLKTFVITAEMGSFSKAAEELYISPSAVIKQINILERDVGVKLFERSHRGLMLTEAGVSFYRDSKIMLKYLEESIERALNTAEKSSNIIRIGTSLMTPSQFVVQLTPQIHKYCPEISFKIVPFDNTPENAVKILRSLGEEIDIVAGVYDNTFLRDRGCTALELERMKIKIAVPLKHRLAKKEKLEVTDLYGENLSLIRRGWNVYVDVLRDYIWKNHQQINIRDFEFYSVDIFNKCESENSLLMMIDVWGGVHPLMKTVDVDWDFSIPFGILHSPEPSPQVKKLIEAVAKIYKE